MAPILVDRYKLIMIKNLE